MSKMQYNAKYKNVGYKIVCVYFYLEKLYSIYLYYILMKKAMAAHSSTLGLKELDTTQQLPFQFSKEKLMAPTPVFLPGESQGRGSLVGCRLWGRTESD